MELFFSLPNIIACLTILHVKETTLMLILCDYPFMSQGDFHNT